MFKPDALAARVKTAAPISVLRIGRLALEWQDAKRADGEMRCWRNNMITTGAYAQIDGAWLENATHEWLPAARVAADVMAGDFGACVSDTIAFWRCRELAAAGRLLLRGDTRHWRGADVRLP
jgi:hypothetical protein